MACVSYSVTYNIYELEVPNGLWDSIKQDHNPRIGSRVGVGCWVVPLDGTVNFVIHCPTKLNMMAITRNGYRTAKLTHQNS